MDAKNDEKVFLLLSSGDGDGQSQDISSATDNKRRAKLTYKCTEQLGAFKGIALMGGIILISFGIYSALKKSDSTPTMAYDSTPTMAYPSGGEVNSTLSVISKVQGVLAWNNCNVLADTCVAGYECCVGPADVASGKTTCRVSGQPNQNSGCYVKGATATTTVAPAPSPPSIVSAWSSCRPTLDSCVSGYKCCVGTADLAANKYTCRADNAVGQSYGCSANNPTAPPPAVDTIAPWSDCKKGVDVCASGYECCTAPSDVATGKTTCRTANALGQSGGCAPPSTITTTSTAPQPTGQKLIISAWNDCRAGVDTCAQGYQCCVAPSDKTSGKTTCRLSGLADNNPSGCTAESQTSPPIYVPPGGLFAGVNVGIGSWFKAIDPPNSNGNSWCNFTYNDNSLGFAVDLNQITEGRRSQSSATNASATEEWAYYGRQWCGLEAVVKDPVTGKSKTLYIIDGTSFCNASTNCCSV